MAVKTAPATVRGKDGAVLTPMDLDLHKAEISRMKAEQDANLEERLKLCNPRHAQEAELKKSVYRWKVEFRVIERKKEEPTKDRYADNINDNDGGDFRFLSVTKHVDAQDEKTAWAKVCDQMGEWPSPKVAKPKFTRLKQLKS